MKLELFILVCSLWITAVFGTGTITVTLFEYWNPSALKYDGACCDGAIPGCPLDQCDHHFDICLSDNTSGTGCNFGLQSVTGPEDTNMIVFPITGSTSVVSFKCETWPGNTLVKINVTDMDSDGSQLVDYFALNHSGIAEFNSSITTPILYNINGTRNKNTTRIVLGIAVYCDQHYYGPQCATKCVGQNDCNGHYQCDEQGHKKCSPGWDGINCTIQISGGEADCGIYEDQREFIPSEWTGSYTCPLQANVSLMLNVTKSENRIEVAGSLTFLAFSLPFSGTYASIAKFVTVQTTGNIISINERNYSSVELNLFLKDSITMNGSIVFLGPVQTTCALYLIRQAAHNATTAPSVLQRSDVECQTTSLKIFVPKNLVPGNGTVTWRDSACVVHSNGTHFVDTVGLRDCGTTLTLEADYVVFENDLILHKNGTQTQNGNNLVTYGSDYEFAIPVKCVYPRNSNISTSYIPIVQQVRIIERRNGQLDLSMRQYEAEDYSQPVPFNAYPRQVPLNNDIFIRLAMENNVTGLGLSADNCFATSTPSPVDQNWYQLISSGCPVNNAKIHPSGVNDVKFSFHAFNFHHNTSGIVYVHCQVSVCLDTDPACVVGCVTRKKRSASSREGAITSNLISTGPFILTADESGVAMSTVIAAVSIAVAVIATVVAIIGWTRKSKKGADS